MDAVAAAAGTTKASLYARFASKEAMFVAVFRWASARPDWPVQDEQPTGLDDVHDLPGLVTALGAIAAASVRRALHPNMIQLTRLAAAHGDRLPVLADHSRLSPWRRYDSLVEVLCRLRAAGVITSDEDPEILVEQFFAMVSGMPARLALFGVVRSPHEQRRRTEAAVRFFVAGISR